MKIETRSDTWRAVMAFIQARREQHQKTLATLQQSERIADECRGALRDLDLLLTLPDREESDGQG